MTPSTSHSAATFRDPAGSLRISGERIFRTVRREYAEDCLSFLRSDVAQAWIAGGRLVETRVLSEAPGEELELEHEPVFFPTYPWEWTPGQWISAGDLTLDLAEQQLSLGRVLKDASPLNVLFRGCSPVFVDVLSTEPRDLEDPLWLAYGQFVRTFLLPLAAFKYLGWPLALSLMHRDGYQPSDLYPHLPARSRFRAPILSQVTLPHLLERRKGSRSSRKIRLRSDIALSVQRQKIKQLRTHLHKLAPAAPESNWSQYEQAADHYTIEDRAHKREFVERVLETARPKHVLDIGANTGEYSRLAAHAGAEVVSWDTDVAAAERNWRLAAANHLRILPVIADVARPTPALGWRNAESRSLLDRARGRFDCVLMLGLIHHLLLTDQIPIREIARLVAELTTRWALVEWIPASDPRFTELCRGREHLYGALDEHAFLRSFSQEFVLVSRRLLNNGRILFLLRRKP